MCFTEGHGEETHGASLKNKKILTRHDKCKMNSVHGPLSSQQNIKFCHEVFLLLAIADELPMLCIKVRVLYDCDQSDIVSIPIRINTTFSHKTLPHQMKLILLSILNINYLKVFLYNYKGNLVNIVLINMKITQIEISNTYLCKSMFTFNLG